jgi:hypothetical protein
LVQHTKAVLKPMRDVQVSKPGMQAALANAKKSKKAEKKSSVG